MPVEDMHESYPSFELEVITDQATALGQLVLDNRADFLLGMYSAIQESDLRGDLVFDHWFSDGFVGLCPAGHRFAGRTIKAMDLTRKRWALPLIEHSALQVLKACFAVEGVKMPTPIISTNCQEIIADAMNDKGMITVVADFTAANKGLSSAKRFGIEGFNF